jgi:hypothetical protein
VLREGFEGPETSFQPAGGDAQHAVLTHARVREAPHDGHACEKIQINAGNGSSVYYRYAIHPAAVIRELSPTVWVRAERPGIAWLARVVLPRSTDPRTGEALTTLLHGAAYQRVGQWERLGFGDLTRLVERQVPGLHSELGVRIDIREAYVSELLLNVYGGPGVTTVWADDLEVGGLVDPSPGAGADGAVAAPFAQASTARPQAPAREVRFQGDALWADRQPLLPRIVQYNGESLPVLRELGFNAIQVDRLPSDALLSAARAHGMWIICPPPPAEALPHEAIDPRFEPVLAWDLGSGISRRELEDVHRWASDLRRADRDLKRPLIASPEAELLEYSRELDVLITGRRTLGTTLELTDYANWLKERRYLALPGTRYWCRIPTQLDPRLENQWAALSGRSRAAVAAGHGQMDLLVSLALSLGCRGLLFESHTPLDAPDPATQRRALALRLINLRLELIEPWIIGGSLVTWVSSSDSSISGAVLETERARLLIPMHWQQGAQFELGHPPSRELSFVVPGIPETNDAYELSPSGMRRLNRARVAGGMHIRLDDYSAGTVVLMTQDPLVIERLSREADRLADTAARVQRDLIIREVAAVEQTLERLAQSGISISDSTTELAAAKAAISGSEVPAAVDAPQRAYRQLRQAAGALSRARRGAWERVQQLVESPVSNPLAVHFETLPEAVDLHSRLVGSPRGSNLLSGGDMEMSDVRQIQQLGWQHVQYELEGVQAGAQLSPEGAYSGRYCLRLEARASDPEAPSQLLPTPPVWVISAPVDVAAGQIVRIHGWVRIDQPIEGSVDGLMIFDSLGGQMLAQRIGRTSGWQEFTLYRAAACDDSVTVTFAMTGLGEANIDAVSIEPVLQSAGAGMQPASRSLGISRLPLVR